jgi:hypothetical protein
MKTRHFQSILKQGHRIERATSADVACIRTTETIDNPISCRVGMYPHPHNPFAWNGIAFLL